MPEATLYRWEDLEQDHPMALIDRRRVMGDRMMISEVRLHQGFAIASHRHDNEQFVVMLAGRARFTIGEGVDARVQDVRGGEVLHLPGGVPHACEAIEECLILDLFSPVSATTGVDTTPPR